MEPLAGGTADTRRRGGRVLLPLALGIAALLALGPVAAGGATVSAAWSATIGSAGVNGKAAISAYTTGTGAITLKLAKLKASTLHPVVLHKGTCSSVGAVLLTLPSIKTTRTAGQLADDLGLGLSDRRPLPRADTVMSPLGRVEGVLLPDPAALVVRGLAQEPAGRRGVAELALGVVEVGGLCSDCTATAPRRSRLAGQ